MNNSALSRYLLLALVVIGTPLLTQAQTYKFSTLYSFKNNGTDPSLPFAGPIVDAADNVYGNAEGGTLGMGTVFKVNKAGELTLLYSFTGGQSDQGSYNLARDKAGNLYGSAGCDHYFGDSCIFKLTPSGEETILYYFTNTNESLYPVGPLTLDSAGNIYGPAAGGPGGGGLVFKIDTTDNYSVLYVFCSLPNCADGSGLEGNLVLDSAGNIYGTNGNGVQNVFKLTPEGVESVLYSFNNTDGTGPEALRQDNLGNLYGLTFTGGSNKGAGTLFKTPKSGGPTTTLYNFCAKPRCADGQLPLGLVLDKAGNVYGTALMSAGNTGSVVWEFSATGKYTSLYTFPKGVETFGGPAIDPDGNLYGFTNDGGTDGRGSVFKLTRQP